MTSPPVWHRVDTVLLDMDGTLLDKHFDDHFWEELVPARFAALRGIPLEEARRRIFSAYRSREQTLAWYDVDYWSEQLGMDIPLLKQEAEHLIAVHPHVLPFLDRVRRSGRPLVMVTNAHAKTLAHKMALTGLDGHFDRIVSSHELGIPKEDPSFWGELKGVVPFDPDRTLLADDTLAILESARAFGIAHLVHLSRPSSRRPPAPSDRFFSVEDFSSLLPPPEPGEMPA